MHFYIFHFSWVLSIADHTTWIWWICTAYFLHNWKLKTFLNWKDSSTCVDFPKAPSFSEESEQGDSPLGFPENIDCESSSLEEVLEAERRWGWYLCQLFHFNLDLNFLKDILHFHVHGWLLQPVPHPSIVWTVWDFITLKNNELFHLLFTCSVVLHRQVSLWRYQATPC